MGDEEIRELRRKVEDLSERPESPIILKWSFLIGGFVVCLAFLFILGMSNKAEIGIIKADMFHLTSSMSEVKTTVNAIRDDQIIRNLKEK